MRPMDLSNHSFGRLLVIERAPTPAWSERITWWRCRCECGKETIVRGHDLREGYTRSCGCLRIELGQRKITHGRRYSREYASWIQMKDRCLNPRSKSFPNYGGRGITISPTWVNDFQQFLTDMGEAPRRQTLDRIDNNGSYQKENCRWATAKQQAVNRRSTVWIEWKGERLTQSQWAQRFNVAPNTIRKYWDRHHSLDAVVALVSD